MAGQNQHIKDYLDAYRIMPNTDFAVMVTGPWGCGKTHFFKEEYLKGIDHLYVSLNAVDHAQDINLAVLKALFPVMGKKATDVLGKAAKGLLQAKFNFNLSEVISLSDFEAKVGDRLLVFDDLERCLLPLEKILGTISGFVVENGIKVVLIGEENYLNKKNDELYDIIKEKVVGKTFRLTERIDEVFSSVVEPADFPATHKLIARNKDHIVKMFKAVDAATEQHNYRALKHALRDFEYFYPQIDEKFTRKQEFLDDLVHVFTTLGYEIQLANLIPKELLDLNSMDEVTRLMSSDADDADKSNFEVVLNRHDLEWSAMYTSSNKTIFVPNFWGRVFSNKPIEPNQLSEAIKNSSYFPTEQAEWVDLWYWRRSTDDAVAAEALVKVRSKLERFEYREYDIIMHVFSILAGLADDGAIEEAKEIIFSSAQEYLNKLVAEHQLEIPEDDRGTHWFGSGSRNLGYWAKEDDFRRLASMIDDAIRRSINYDQKIAVATWIDQIKAGDGGDFVHELGIYGKYSHSPALKDVDSNEFVAALDQAPNYTKWYLGGSLGKRYGRFGAQLIEELPFWEGVAVGIDDILSKHEGLVTPSHMNMREIRNVVGEIIQTLRQLKEADSGKEGAT